MNKWLPILLFLSGQCFSRTVVAQSKPAGPADGNPFATSPLFATSPAARKSSLKTPVPTADQLCLNNGWERLQRGDKAGAVLEFSRCIQLRPNSGQGYRCRAIAERKPPDYTESLADCTRAVELNPHDGSAYRTRAITQMLARHWPEAVADLRTARRELGQDDGYPAVLLWLARTRLGETDAANKELAAFFSDSGEFNAVGEWVQQVGRFLLDRETEEELLQAAGSKKAAADKFNHNASLVGMSPGSLDPKFDPKNGPLCEAWFYSGMKRLQAGDKDAAAEHFRQCLATKQTLFTEYEFAEAELSELQR